MKVFRSRIKHDSLEANPQPLDDREGQVPQNRQLRGGYVLIRSSFDAWPELPSDEEEPFFPIRSQPPVTRARADDDPLDKLGSISIDDLMDTFEQEARIDENGP